MVPVKDNPAHWCKPVVPALLAACLIGCAHDNYGSYEPPPYPPLGTEVDELMMQQEVNAEASKYVVYCHEFEPTEWNGKSHRGGWRLTPYGEDHVKQIAVNAARGDAFPIIVQRSEESVKPGTQYEYPVHFNEPLDEQRRQVIVASLQSLGVPDAEERVVIAPAIAEGLTAGEAARSYRRGFNLFSGSGLGGFGGGFGGGGFRGFGGGF